MATMQQVGMQQADCASWCAVLETVEEDVVTRRWSDGEVSRVRREIAAGGKSRDRFGDHSIHVEARTRCLRRTSSSDDVRVDGIGRAVGGASNSNRAEQRGKKRSKVHDVPCRRGRG